MQYEITAILKGSTVQDSTPGRESVEAIFKKYNVQVTDRQEWGHKKFWHPINKTPDGTYVHYQCEAEPSAIIELNHEFHLAQPVLRVFVIRKDPAKERKAKAAKKLAKS